MIPINSDPSHAEESHTMPQTLRQRLLDSPSARFNLANSALNVSILLCAYLQQVSDTRYTLASSEIRHAPPMMDVLQENLPWKAIPLLAANIFVLSGLVFTVTGLLLVLQNWSARIMALQRAFWVLSILLLFRSFCISMTITTPARGPECEFVTTTGHTWYVVLGNTFLVVFGVKIPCTPAFPSQNAILLTTFLVQWTMYTHDWRIHVYAYLHWITGCVLTVLARIDYTAAVIMGCGITWLCFKVYFSLQWMAVQQHIMSQPIQHAQLYRMDTVVAATPHHTLFLRPESSNPCLGWLLRMVVWMDGLDLRQAKENASQQVIITTHASKQSTPAIHDEYEEFWITAPTREASLHPSHTSSCIE